MIPRLTICPYAKLHTDYAQILCDAPGYGSLPPCSNILKVGECPRIAELKKLGGMA